MSTLSSPARIEAGASYPLGVSWDGSGTNVALFSANATAVELCLFDAAGEREVERIALPERTDEVWHGYLRDLRPGAVYGFRVHGPWAPEAGHRFNPAKLLLDPYARAIQGRMRWGPEVFGHRLEGGDDRVQDGRDSAAFVPKSVVADPAGTWSRRPGPAVPWDRTVIYEAHVRGFTKRHPGLPPELRGTFSGLAAPGVAGRIAALGATSVELLPVHAFVDEPALVRRGLVNFWGYNTVGFFAPHPAYATAPGAAVAEFRAMVDGLHEVGLEVILDVVFNHTGEGDELGPTLCFRGIDNASYYRLQPDGGHYVNDTGCGNTVNCNHPRVVQMVMDSLRHWVEAMGVDGFRFDLAPVLGRNPRDFDAAAPLLQAIGRDPVLARVKLIAEAWDAGANGWQVGRFPPGWAEWNDRFRDEVRAFWRGDGGRVPELAGRLSGSADLFEHRGRRPWATVNFVTAHDGFTLRDLVSFERKHNDANGEGGRDGTDRNLSANYGAEGETNDPAILDARWRTMRNLVGTLLLSQGTPMLVAGDEWGRTQGGNNNAYCQDNETSWVDWDIPAAGLAQEAWVRRLLQLRREHPALNRGRFLSGQDKGGVRDVTWFGGTGAVLRDGDWGDPALRCLGMLIDGRADGTADDALLVVSNGGGDEVRFTLPSCPGGTGWVLLLDSAAPERGAEEFGTGAAVSVAGRSLLVFALRMEA